MIMKLIEKILEKYFSWAIGIVLILAVVVVGIFCLYKKTIGSIPEVAVNIDSSFWGTNVVNTKVSITEKYTKPTEKISVFRFFADEFVLSEGTTKKNKKYEAIKQFRGFADLTVDLNKIKIKEVEKNGKIVILIAVPYPKVSVEQVDLETNFGDEVDENGNKKYEPPYFSVKSEDGDLERRILAISAELDAAAQIQLAKSAQSKENIVRAKKQTEKILRAIYSCFDYELQFVWEDEMTVEEKLIFEEGAINLLDEKAENVEGHQDFKEVEGLFIDCNAVEIKNKDVYDVVPVVD